MARVRMSAIALAVLIQQRVGIETIIHFTSRDRNLMAIQSDLLGAHALGIRNVIALTGDPPSTRRLRARDGRLGRRLDRLHPHPEDAERRHRLGGQLDRQGHGLLRRLRRQPDGRRRRPRGRPRAPEDRGRRRRADDAADLQRGACSRASSSGWGRSTCRCWSASCRCRAIAHTEFIHNELAGVFVPEDVRERMRDAGENGIAEGIAQARELLRACRPLRAGRLPRAVVRARTKSSASW